MKVLNTPMCSDLNLPKSNWHANIGLHHDVYTLFLSHIIESSYQQLVSFPTRDSSNILDVILTSETSLFSAIESDLPASTSDHLSVKFVITLPCHKLNSCNHASIVITVYHV